MKKYKRQPEKFEVFDLFSSLGPEWNLQFNDENSIRKFCEGIASSLRRYTTPIMLYGRHVESMFGYVAASLGECAVVKREDDGDVFLEIGDAKIPDYRLITKEKGTYLVEVKNFHGNDNLFMVNQEYFMQLQRYAEVNGIELKIAVYWSKWNLWTLLSPTAFVHKDKKVLISIAEAIKQNEMSCILGDVLIGTLPRLSLKIYLEHLSQGNLPEREEIVYRITKRWSSSLLLPTLPSTRTRSWKQCTKGRRDISRVKRKPEKTHRPGKRRGAVCPAHLLRGEPAPSC